jgi:HSP20 family protein
MTRVQVYDPFAGSGIDELFSGFFAPVRRGDQDAPAGIKIDVSESEKGYVVRAEIPGVGKEDIDVAIEGNQVTIGAEVKRETEKKDGERVLRTERYYGKLQRAFQLGQAVDENAANAKYADGILELTLPKKAVTQAKRISIQ